MRFEKESEVARPVVRWLEDMQWDVYQEVKYGGRADIVALQGPLIWVVEVKRTLTFEVIEQALAWRRRAHYVSIAVPDARSQRWLAEQVCRQFELGMFEVKVVDTWNNKRECRVEQRLDPRLGRSRLLKYQVEGLRKNCRPECKTWGEAGNALAQYYSPFRGTCQAIREYLKKSGPSPVKAVIAGISHHYKTESTARSSIVRWAQYDKIPGVALDTSTRPATLRLLEQDGANAA